MTTRIILVIVLLASQGAGSLLAVQSDDETTAAEAAAAANSSTPAGGKYQETIGQFFGRDHAVTVGQRAKTTKRPQLSDFDLLLRVDAGATVGKSWFTRGGTSHARAGQAARLESADPPRAEL